MAYTIMYENWIWYQYARKCDIVFMFTTTYYDIIIYQYILVRSKKFLINLFIYEECIGFLLFWPQKMVINHITGWIP